MYWKLTLDPPHTYAVETGSVRSRYASDFHETPGQFSGTWRCPVTGLVMLRPSTMSRNFGTDFRGIGNFRQNVANAVFWQRVQKSIDNLDMFTTTRPAGQVKFFDALTVAAGLAVFNANVAFYDTLEWALESTFSLNIDEGFAIHYHGLTDELLRKENWFAVQWDNIYIHFSHQGHVRVLYYPDRGHIEDTPEVVEEFDICQAGELLGYSGFFVFLPIPGYGLALYHSKSPQRQRHLSANGNAFAARGAHLIPWQARKVGSHFRLFESSLVRLALNPYHANIIGFQNLTFESSGTYLEEVFDPGYRPALLPDDVTVGALQNFGGQFGDATATLRNSANTANWTAGTDRQGRIQFDISTDDTRYTPFIYGWGVQWLPIFQTRDPGAVEITDQNGDVLQRLEWTDDSEGNFEGSCRLKIETPEACAIVERGEATFQIEFSEDNEDWTVLNGGIIKFGKPKMMYHPDWGFFWQVTATLHGQEERFEELPNNLGTAFDGLTIGEGINLVLSTSGFSQIDEADMPAALTNLRIPALQSGTNFRYHPRFGDKYKHILRLLLFLARTQNQEYKMVYDWENEVWVVARRPKNEDGDAWILTWDEEAEDFDEGIAYYVEPLEFEFQPVEATTFTVLGVAESGDKEKATVYESTPITNDSAVRDAEIDGAANPDYTGRVKGIRIVAPGIASVQQANDLARKINPRFFHRNVTATIMLPPGHFSLDISPDVMILLTLPPVRGEDEERVFELWVKKRTVVIEGDDHSCVAGIANEQVILQMEAIWENPVKGE